MANKKSKKDMPIVLTCDESNTRIVMRKNNPSKNKKKLKFNKYDPLTRSHVSFTEKGKERHN